MSNFRIDKKHEKLLDDLLSHYILKGKKITKQELLAKLIDDAIEVEGLKADSESGSNSINEEKSQKC